MSKGLLSHPTAQDCLLLLERTGTGSLSRGRHRLLLEGGEVNVGYWNWPPSSPFGLVGPVSRFNKHETGNVNSQVSPPNCCCSCFSE